MQRRVTTWVIRITLALLVIASVALFHAQFAQQFNCYLHGAASVIHQQWHIVALNIVLFVFLLLPLSFRRRAKWGEYGMVIAFFVSLFIEMYGFPFTLYIASRYFAEPVRCAEVIFSFSMLGVDFGMELAMVYTSFLIAIGTALILVGWVTLYKHRNAGPFVTSGIYHYSRHPQYLGFIIIVLSWLLAWPTLITVIFVPLLVYKYVQVCRTEELEVLAEHPEYEEYKKRVPFLL